ncbi:MAG: leucyl/phenylalanyl-tRNA--protein transferase [Rhodanobacteraceae bacterium]
MSPLPITFLRPGQPPDFPHPAQAMTAPNGLLAAGGELSPEWLVQAYSHGIFPWFSEEEPILWWSPDPRCVFHTDCIHVSRSLQRQLRRCGWHLRADACFREVIEACAEPRGDGHGSWLTPSMIDAYCDLHGLGHAHSIEVHDGDRLVGGLYGVATGRMFCGESMFSAETGGSKVALLAIARVLHHWGWPLLDAQVPNPHLLRMGARMMPRTTYLSELGALQQAAQVPGSWREIWPFARASDLLDSVPTKVSSGQGSGEQRRS